MPKMFLAVVSVALMLGASGLASLGGGETRRPAQPEPQQSNHATVSDKRRVETIPNVANILLPEKTEAEAKGGRHEPKEKTKLDRRSVAYTREIVSIGLQNTTATPLAAGYVTFGHVFAAGDLLLNDHLVARIAEHQDTPIQFDPKVTHGDGSVRHAVLTFLAPALAVGGIVSVGIVKKSAAMPLRRAPALAELLTGGYDETATLTYHAPNTAVETASAAAALAQGASPWLTGPLVNEWRAVSYVNERRLRVMFDVRAYADGTTRTDVIFCNDWLLEGSKSDAQYDIAISDRYSYQNIYQYLYTRWHHEISRSKPHIRFDPGYMIAAGAVLNYDTSLHISAAAIAADVARLSVAMPYTGFPSMVQTRYGPMGTGTVTVGMPNTGARADIGPLPAWTTRWLLSQSPDAWRVMMTNADASGTVPWHFTDEATGEPVSRLTYPLFTMYVTHRQFVPQPANGWPSGFYSATQPWSPDGAHMPDLTYIPYLITGSRYYLDLLKHQANYQITWHNPFYQYFDAPGPTNPTDNPPYLKTAIFGGQGRAIAWGVRQVAQALYLCPDTDQYRLTLASQLETALGNAIEWYMTRDAFSKYGEIKGFIPGNEYSDVDAGGPAKAVSILAPWQEGYLELVLVWVARMRIDQSAHARQLVEYLTPFVAGLFLKQTRGYNPFNGAAYFLLMQDPMSGGPIASWSDLNAKNVQYRKIPATITELPGLSVSGAPAIQRAGLAAIAALTGSDAARAAFDFIDSRFKANRIVGWETDPTWAIRPN